MLGSFRSKNILVIVAHPDDEVLGLGASMYRLISNYDCRVRVVILGEGITSRSNQRDVQKWSKELEIHRSNINEAAKKIGYESLRVYSFPDNRFDTIPLLDIIKIIEKEKLEFRPEVIFTHHGGDVNIDHQRTFEAVITACRPMEGEKVATIVSFETMSGTEWRASSDPKHFVPNYFIEINKEGLDIKQKAMESYEFERRKYPHPRSPEALEIRAKMWGVTIGVEFAEAFYIVRSIDKI